MPNCAKRACTSARSTIGFVRGRVQLQPGKQRTQQRSNVFAEARSSSKRVAERRSKCCKPGEADALEVSPDAEIGYNPRGQLLSRADFGDPVAAAADPFEPFVEDIGDDHERAQRKCVIDCGSPQP